MTRQEKVIARAILLDNDLCVGEYSKAKDHIFLIDIENGFELRDHMHLKGDEYSFLRITMKVVGENKCDIIKEFGMHKKGKDTIKRKRTIKKGVANNEDTKKQCLVLLLRHGSVKHLSGHWYFTYIKAHSYLCVKGKMIVK